MADPTPPSAAGSPMPLLQAVKQGAASMTSAGTSPTAAATGLGASGGEQTQQTAQLMGTAQTGKEQAPGIGGQARLSALGEKLAGMNTLMQSQAVQEGGVLQSTAQQQQAAAQQQQYAGQLATLSVEKLNAQESYQNQVSGMLQQQKDQIQSMVNSDNKSRVEQMGLLMRLGNETYINQLNSKATEARLTDKAAFQDALNRSVFAQETDMLGQSLQFRSYMQQSVRDTEKSVASMDLGFAVQMATIQNKSAASTTMWSGIGTLAGAGVAAGAGAYADSAAAESETTPEEGQTLPLQSSENPEQITPLSETSQAAGAGDLGSLNYLSNSNG